MPTQLCVFVCASAHTQQITTPSTRPAHASQVEQEVAARGRQGCELGRDVAGQLLALHALLLRPPGATVLGTSLAQQAGSRLDAAQRPLAQLLALLAGKEAPHSDMDMHSTDRGLRALLSQLDAGGVPDGVVGRAAAGGGQLPSSHVTDAIAVMMDGVAGAEAQQLREEVRQFGMS